MMRDDGERLGGVALSAALEALLIISADPVTAGELGDWLGVEEDEVTAALESLAIEYAAARRGFELRRVAGGWRFYSAAHCAQITSRWVTDGKQAKLSQAALETLAVIAYRQPVTRARIGAIRGVNVDGTVRTLQARGLIEQCGQEPLSGAALYRTTQYFLDRMGLRDLSELEPIVDLLPDPEDVAAHVDGEPLELP